MPDGSEDVAAIARYLVETHEDWLAAIADAADDVAADWQGDETADRAAVVEPFEAALRQRGAIAAAPAVLLEAADRVGLELPAPPVADTPYVVVTGEGLVCRATGASRRLVVTIAVFAVDLGPPARYRRAEEPVDTAVSVEFRK